MDLSSLEMKSDTIAMEVLHPVKHTPITLEDGTPMVVHVHGRYSSVYRSVQQAQQNARLKRTARGGKLTITSEEIAADRLDLVARCVASWNILVNGETPAVDRETVKRVFEKLPWLREQVEDAVEDSQGFLTNSD